MNGSIPIRNKRKEKRINILQEPAPRPKRNRIEVPRSTITIITTTWQENEVKDNRGGPTIHSRVGLQELNGKRAGLPNMVTRKLSMFFFWFFFVLFPPVFVLVFFPSFPLFPLFPSFPLVHARVRYFCRGPTIHSRAGLQELGDFF